MTQILDHSVFATAGENMAYDEQLLANLAPGAQTLRVYQWQQPGITYSHRQEGLTAPLTRWDSSRRVTGGGILFHSPGDLVFSWVGHVADPQLPSGIKSKLILIAEAAEAALQAQGLPAKRSCQCVTSENLAFCHTYQSPYEVWVGNEKIVGITLRRFRDKFIVQGIFHVQSNVEVFQLPPEWHSFLSLGLGQTVAFDALADQFSKNVWSSRRTPNHELSAGA